jgi:hypothetical protein
LNGTAGMRNIYVTAGATALLLLGCRGEPVPRDYRNHPPAMTHPATSSGDTPTAHGMRGAAPEPSKGAEGKSIPPPTPMPQNAPVDTAAPASTTTTQTTVTTATHT